MTHGGRDQASVLNSFDDNAAAVFASLCHLTAGDHRTAQDLLVRTFSRFLPPDPDNYDSPTGSLDRRSMIVAAHRCFLDDGSGAGATGSGPLSTLTPVERAVIDLRHGERMSSTATALALRIAESEIEGAATTGRDQLSEATFGRPIERLLAETEVWFDDAMRSRCRTEVEDALSMGVPTRSAGVAVTPAGARRIKVAASIAAAVLVAIAIGVWLAPSDRSTDTSADLGATTTKVSSTGVSKKDPSELPDPAIASPTTTAPVLDGGASEADAAMATGYILDPPPVGYVGAGAGSDSPETPAANWLEVWASDDATRTTGRWFAIMVDSDPTSAIPVLRDATRSTIAGNSTLIATDAAGVTRVIQRRPDERTVRFETFGLTADDVRQVILATLIESDGTVAATPRFGEVVFGLQLVWGGRTSDPGFVTRAGGSGRTRATYRTTDGASEIDLTAAPQTPNDLQVSRLLTPAPAPADSFDPKRLVVVTDGGALIGQIPPESDATASPLNLPTLVATWHDGAMTVTVQATLPLDQLIQLARSAHLASADAWAAARRSENQVPPPAPATGAAFEFSSIGTGTTAAGDLWKVGIVDIDTGAVAMNEQQHAHPASTEPVPAGVNAYAAIAPDAAQPLVEFASFDATIVLAVFDLAPPTGVTALRVTVDGGAPVDVPIVAVDKPAWSGAAVAFSETASYTATLVDASGNVVQTLVTTPDATA